MADGHHAAVSAPILYRQPHKDFVSLQAAKVQIAPAPGHGGNAALTFVAALLSRGVMILQQWRARLAFVGLSAFLAWHTMAMLIAPAPDASALVQALRVPLRPYLSFFRLDNMWDFFSPNVGRGSQFRYIIEDNRGNHHPFAPTANLSWFHPTFFWFRSWFDAVMANPDTYADSAAAFLCRKHASLHPVSVIMLEAAGEDYTPEDYLAGKDPMSSEFVTVTTVKRVSCEGPQHSSA